MHTHMHTGVSSVDTIGLVLRVLLLAGTALVAGIGLLRSGAEMRPKIAWTAGLVTAALAATSAIVLDINVSFAIVHVLLALAVPITLRMRAVATFVGFALTLLLIAEAALGHTSFDFFLDTIFVAVAVIWLGYASAASWREPGLRLRPAALVVAIVLAAAGIGELVLSGLFDRRLWETSYGLVLILLVAAAVITPVFVIVLRDTTELARYGAVSVLVALLAWSALPGLPKPLELPQPGVARLAQTAGTTALVSPQRPGPNLVHFPDSAGTDITVEAGGRTVQALPRPGTTGTWAQVDLPPGRSDLMVMRAGQHGMIDVDTGDLPAMPDAAGADGPECASAALGGIVAGAPAPIERCPDAELLPEDADALRKEVDYLAGARVGSVNIVGDDTPRGRAASEVVRVAAAQHGIPVNDSRSGALILVSGWDRAAETLRGGPYLFGNYLAPWLLHGPVVNATAGAALPLRFDPRDQAALEYGMSLARSFGDSPSLSGYRQWARTRGGDLAGDVSIYASAQVDVMQMQMMSGHDHADSADGTWIPQGTIVAVSGPLRS